MMDFKEYGVPGVIVTVLIAAIIWMVKYIEKKDESHKSERKDLADKMEKQFGISNELQKDTNKEINRSNTLMTEIATILKESHR